MLTGEGSWVLVMVQIEKNQLQKAQLIRAFLVGVMGKKVDDSCVTRKVALVPCSLGDKTRQSVLCLTYCTGRCLGRCEWGGA